MRGATAERAPAIRTGDRVSAPPSDRFGDLVRLGLAVGLFGITLLAIQRDRLSELEENVFRLMHELPGWLLLPFQVIEQLGSRLAPVVVGVLVVLALRRVRLGLGGIAVAGTAAWIVAQLLKTFFERPRPAEFMTDLPHELSSGGPGFVSGHTAVATAIVAVTAPYLPRRWRRVVWAVPALVGFARIYGGGHLPLDVVGGFAVGWFMGTLVHLLVGVTRPQRTPDVVADMLGRLGLDAASVEPADVFARVSHAFRVTTREGQRLFVKVLDPDPRSTDWVLRIGKVLASREQRDISALASLSAAADHEASVVMAARSAGVRAPGVVLARGTGAAAVVVLEEIPGRDLSELPSEALTDQALHELWEEVARMHRARIAHRDLVRDNVLLDVDGRPWLVDFFDAEVGASEISMSGDVAELIASLAIAIGPERAVASARDVLGPQTVGRALPGLERFALSPRTRRELLARPALLDEVRAAAGGGPEATADLLSVRRIWLPAVVAAVGYGVLLTIVGWGAAYETLAESSKRWIGVAAVVLLAVPVLQGWAMSLAVRRRVAVGRSAVAAAVASSVEVIAGPAARRHHLVRYFRSCGGRGDEPGEAVDLVMTAEVIGGLVVLASGVGLTWWRGDLNLKWGSPIPTFLAVAVVAAVAGWIARRLMERLWPRVSLWDDLHHAVKTARVAPGRASAVLACVAGGELAMVIAVAATVHAVGPSEPVAVVAIAVAGARLFMAILGIGALPVVFEAASIAALSVVGVPPAHAVVAVLVYAVFRYWIVGGVSNMVGPRLAPTHVPTHNP